MDPYSLKYPFPSVSKPGTTVGVVTLARPKAKHLDAMERARERSGDMAAVVSLVAGITGQSVEDVGEMDAADFTAVSAMATDFLSDTGSTPAPVEN